MKLKWKLEERAVGDKDYKFWGLYVEGRFDYVAFTSDIDGTMEADAPAIDFDKHVEWTKYPEYRWLPIEEQKQLLETLYRMGVE